MESPWHDLFFAGFAGAVIGMAAAAKIAQLAPRKSLRWPLAVLVTLMWVLAFVYLYKEYGGTYIS
ncbi:MAG: hypothetical protein HRU19_12475 [Pseudobacteriovorax sp.]|nr:hypothetical protein [Pseudobacteriovorax sp.]